MSTTPYQTYTISLNQIIDTGGSCKNFNITWEDPSCGEVSCEISESTLEVQVPDGCKECFVAWIECAEDCINCQPEKVTICPCSKDSDCDGCSTCDQDTKLCVSSCVDSEWCDDDLDICKECDEDHPCSGDKICENFKCVCPPDKPYLNKDGECYPCDPNNVPNCYICTADGLIPKDCGDKVCDPETDDCVCCLGSGDVGPNEECRDKQCVCKPGFQRDVNGDCVPQDECDVDGDCSACEVCNKYKKCEPKKCPEGTVPVDDGAGNCDCKTPCTNGSECGQGQGCDGEYCQDCDKQGCEGPECEQLLGCGCADGDLCEDIDSCGETPCDKPSDCPGKNCTCYKGQCVDCRNFACTDCENIPGCGCVGSKGCVGKEEPCEDTIQVTEDASNCDIIGELQLSTGCSCSPVTAVFKVENPRAAATNSITVDYKIELKKGAAGSINEATTLPRLDDTTKKEIADNDTPVSGTVRISQVLKLQEVDSVTGQPKPVDPIYYTVYNNVVSFADAGVKVLQNKKIYKKGEEFTIDSTTYNIEEVAVKAVQNNDLDFTGRSGCDYEASNTVANIEITSSIYSDISNGNLSGVRRFKSLFSEGTRNPMLTWFRAEPDAVSYDVDNDFIRKLYMPGTAGLHEDILYGPDRIPETIKQDLDPSEGELYTGYKYAFQSDCACDEDFVDHGPLAFCQPDELDVTFTNCGKKFQITSFSVCDVNQDLDQFANTPSDAQVYFDLYVNDVLEGTYRHRQTGGIKTDSGKDLFREISRQRSITSIKLVQRTPLFTVCERTVQGETPDLPALDISDPICGAGSNGSIQIPKSNNGEIIDSVTSSNANVVWDGTNFVLTAEKGATFHYVVNYVNGCVIEGEITPDFCEACYELTVTADAIVEGSALVLDVVIGNGESPFDWEVVKSGSVIKTGESTSATFSISIDGATGGTYTVRGTDANNCQAEDSVQATVTSVPDLTFNSPNFCEGDDAVFTISNIPSDLIGAVLKVNRTVDGVTTNNIDITLTSSNVQETVTAPTGDVTYELLTLTLGGQEVEDYGSEVHTQEFLEEGQVTSFLAASGVVCSGGLATINVQGTPNSTVVLTNGDEIVLDGSGQGTYEVSGLGVGTYTYTVDYIEQDKSQIQGDTCVTNITGVDETVEIVAGPNMITYAECVSESDTSDRKVYFSVNEVPGSGIGQFSFENTSNGSSLTGVYEGADPNNSGYYRASVTVAHNESVSVIEGTYTSNDGCEVSETEAVPNCAYPPMQITVADPVDGCQTPSQGIVLDVTEVTIGGSVQSESTYKLTYYDGNTALGTVNPAGPYTYNAPAGSYGDLSVEVEVVSGPYTGHIGTANFPTAVVDDVEFDIILDGGGTPPSEQCLGVPITLGQTGSGPGDTVSWDIDRNGSNFDDVTATTYVFNPNQEGNYTITVDITTADGCTGSETISIIVLDCACSVQYVEVSGTGQLSSVTDIDSNTQTFTSTDIECYGSGATANDNLASKIKTALTNLGAVASTEVLWQYMDQTCNVRFYVFGSNIELSQVSGNAGTFSFVRDCISTDAPGCPTTSSSNYSATLNSNSTGIDIQDDGDECFTEGPVLDCYEVIANTDAGRVVRLEFNSTAGNFEVQNQVELANFSAGQGDIAVSQTHGLFAVRFSSLRYMDIDENNPANSQLKPIGTLSEDSVNGVFLDDDTFFYSSEDGERFYTVDLSAFDPNSPSAPSDVQVIDFSAVTDTSDIPNLLANTGKTPGDIFQLGGYIYYNVGSNLYRFQVDGANSYVADSFEDLGTIALPGKALGLANLKGQMIAAGRDDTSQPNIEDKIYVFNGTLGGPDPEDDISDNANYTLVTDGGGNWETPDRTIFGLASLEDSGVSC